MTEFGTISYGAVGVLYAVLTVLLLVNWRGHRPGGLLIAACLVSTIWAVAVAATISGRAIPDVALFGIEVVRSGAWLTFLTTLLAQLGIARMIRVLGHATWIGVLAVGIAVWTATGTFSLMPDLGTVLNAGGLLIALIGLLLLEQLHRNSPKESHRGINALALGLGGLFAYDLFLYSQGVLIGGIESTAWAARGAVNIAFVPLIAIAARRNPDWNLDIFVSRQVVFYSTSLAGVGVYLLLMSGVGYWLSIYGGIWSNEARLVFFIGAGLLLVLLLFSSRLRARLRVFLSKHFFRNKYDYREEWLRLISTLAGFEDSSTRQIVIKALAQIVDSPAGMLWVLNDQQNSYQLVSVYETTEEMPNIAMDDPVVKFIKQEVWLIDLREYADDPELYGDLEIPEWLAQSSEAWLIVPLVTRQELLGMALLEKAPGTPKLNYEDRDLLKTVGNHIAVHLAQEKTAALLSEARQFEAYNRLTAFLMHDLNNLIAQQSLIVANASKHKRNPDFVDDAMQTIANSVERMKRVMDQLRRGAADRVVRTTDLRFVVSAAVDRCSGREPVPRLEICDNGAVVEVDIEQFTMVLTHLIRNAQESTPPTGDVTVRTNMTNGQASVTVSDTGSGMSPEFVRERLFRPFDSTKGSQGMGIGAYQAREFARRMGGDLKVQSEVARGTTITMTLPVS